MSEDIQIHITVFNVCRTEEEKNQKIKPKVAEQIKLIKEKIYIRILKQFINRGEIQW